VSERTLTVTSAAVNAQASHDRIISKDLVAH
jgi:hypothetical protein